MGKKFVKLSQPHRKMNKIYQTLFIWANWPEAEQTKLGNLIGQTSENFQIDHVCLQQFSQMSVVFTFFCTKFSNFHEW